MKIIQIMSAIILLLSHNSFIYPQQKKKNKKSTNIESLENIPATIPFNYNSEPLINIMYEMEKYKNISIIPPQNPPIKERVTYTAENPLSIDQAWQLFLTMLDMSDYVLSKRENAYLITRKNNNTLRETYPIFINTPITALPPEDAIIRYLYYATNIKVGLEKEHEINVILRELLSPTSLFIVDPLSNSILITDKASKIKDVMTIIAELDQVMFQEKMEILELHHTDARIVANLMNEGLLKTATEVSTRYNLDARKQNELSYFSRGTRVVPIPHLNALTIVGRAQAVDRVIDFIKTYVDREQESAESILHVYPLQYLTAKEFEPVLRRIIESTRSGGTAQAQAGEGGRGFERFFDEVYIRADDPVETTEELKFFGGNNIVVAGRPEDVKQIEKLIEQLDTPQPQVLLEILIADLTIADTRALGALTRNPAKVPIFNESSFQAAHLEKGIIPDNSTSPTTVATDLLRLAYDSNGNLTDDNPVLSAASFISSGNTVISLNDNDGKTWSILEMLKLFNHSKVLSHPHIIATNNKRAFVKVGEDRLLPDETSESQGGAAVRKFRHIQAALQVEITPRISTADTVNLQVQININDFIEGSSNAQVTREVTTNANIKSGDIFAVGGLLSLANNQSAAKTPLLSEVPVIGWLFKKRQNIARENNLTVFICPTIIQPRLRKGIGEYTQDYINIAKGYSDEGSLFDSLRDPITRLFFNAGTRDMDTGVAIEDFILTNNPPRPTHNISTPAQKAIDAQDSLIPHEKVISEDIKVSLKNSSNPFLKKQKTDQAELLAEQRGAPQKKVNARKRSRRRQNREVIT